MVENHKIYLNDGDPFAFTSDDCVGTNERVSVSYKNLANEVSVGDTILVNNGLLSFRVIGISGNTVNCEVIVGGEMSDRKSMNFPNHVLQSEYLSEQDKEDLLFGIKNGVDFIAASFVSTKDDVASLRQFLNDNGGNDIDIIAKIENRSGVDHIDEICEIADGVMVARGDLGVEIPFVEVPSIQKFLIKKCRLLGKRVITATEMLESMIEKPRPTRAEISDVANAVFDGSSCVMLSGETASGKYPAQAVKAMALISIDAEQHIDYSHRFSIADFEITDLTDALSHSAGQLAIDTHARCIVSSTMSGETARMVSRNRTPMPIIGMTCKEKTYRQMAMYWNVTPVLVKMFDGLEDLIISSRQIVKEKGFADSGDVVVVTGGLTNTAGGTKLIHADIIE